VSDTARFLLAFTGCIAVAAISFALIARTARTGRRT